MTKQYSDINWDDLHGISNYIETGECWRECGSYCCKTNHPDFSFRFIRPNQVLLPLCPAEYKHLKSKGYLPDNSVQAVNRLSIEFKTDKSAAVYMVRCDRGGMCDHPDFRPLICKVYPYFPFPSPDGQIKELVLGSVFDVARWAKDQHLACPALRSISKDVREKAMENYARLFNHPHLIFYFRAAWGIMKLMQDSLQNKYSHILELPIKEYFKQWEVLYMTGALTPAAEIAKICRGEYDKISEIWGEFELE